MVLVKFNKDYNDKELERLVKADEPVEMTVKRADEVIRKIKKQADEKEQFKGYADFNYERVDEETTDKDEKESGD